jgi:hypothetical protein
MRKATTDMTRRRPVIQVLWVSPLVVALTVMMTPW